MKRHLLGAGSLALAALACTGPAAPLDAGLRGADAGPSDAGPSDAGIDAPYFPLDAGPAGAALEPALACDDVAAELYATPADLPPFTPEARGELIGCSLLETIDAAELAARLAPSEGVSVVTGVRVYLVRFRTATAPDAGAISTALVVLPDAALSERVPLVLAMHGSVGLADQCAPTILRDAPPAWLRASYVDAMFLAWAARGLPVIAPDYPGLGTEGTHAYASWTEPARSGIDAARALRSMLPASRLAGDTLVYGHSQGGGLALAVAAVADEAPDLDLSALVSIAPGYRLTTFAMAFRLTSFALDATLRATVALGVYAELAQLTSDPVELGSAFAPGVRARILEVAESECYGDAVLALDEASAGYVPPATIGELFDETFRTAALACADGGDCTTLAGRLVVRDAANEPVLDASAPPLLFLASEDDPVVTPGFVGCAIDRVRREGVTDLEACTEAGADHLGIVESGSALAIEWALAARAGAPRPPCPGTSTAPRCRLF